MRPHAVISACLFVVAGCSLRDSQTARSAEHGLIGLSVVDLETCIGVPNRRDTFDQTSILTYDESSTSSGGLSMNLPIVGDVSFSGGGYCHLNIRLDYGRVTSVHYTGETDSPLAPEAYCAPIVRNCIQSLGIKTRRTPWPERPATRPPTP